MDYTKRNTRLRAVNKGGKAGSINIHKIKGTLVIYQESSDFFKAHMLTLTAVTALTEVPKYF